MKMFGRTGGYYLFWTGFVYFAAGLADLWFRFCAIELLQMAWILVLLLPLTIRPVARYFNMRLFWEF